MKINTIHSFWLSLFRACSMLSHMSRKRKKCCTATNRSLNINADILKNVPVKICSETLRDFINIRLYTQNSRKMPAERMRKRMNCHECGGNVCFCFASVVPVFMVCALSQFGHSRCLFVPCGSFFWWMWIMCKSSTFFPHPHVIFIHSFVLSVRLSSRC